MDPPLRRNVATPDGLQRLHQLSRTFNMIENDLTDISERHELLIEMAGKLLAAGVADAESSIERLTFLHSRNRMRRRWVRSFDERTKLISNFVFSIAAQKNNLTNLEIANWTSVIAEEAREDNSSMITYVILNSLSTPFLPSLVAPLHFVPSS
jgi:hypothetical protein